ncbi:MAG: ComF family protein [Chitinophagaceae bacterium]
MKNHPYVRSLLHLFFPHVCAGCGNDLIAPTELLCLHCINHLPVTDFHRHANNPVEKIFWGRLPLVAASSHFYFTKDSLLQHLMHQLKYQGNKALGYYFGEQIGVSITSSDRFSNIDALIPLPLFAARERKRAYNQSALLCKGIASILQIPVWNNVVVRRTMSSTQTGKSRIERWQNMEGRFELLPGININNKHLLLVDDVVTTGATLEACGQQLLAAHNVRLSIVTMAIAVR